jgi:hypothetical protein
VGDNLTSELSGSGGADGGKYACVFGPFEFLRPDATTVFAMDPPLSAGGEMHLTAEEELDATGSEGGGTTRLKIRRGGVSVRMRGDLCGTQIELAGLSVKSGLFLLSVPEGAPDNFVGRRKGVVSS